MTNQEPVPVENESRLRVGVILGSTREGRFGDVVARWFLRQLEPRSDFEPDLIDLLELDLPTNLSRQASPVVSSYLDRLDRADAFVIITPEYNHSFPGPLKGAIDIATTHWHRKPVGFVSYGGLSGGLRAVEHLRPVFAEVRAVTVRDTVSFHGPWSMFDDAGDLHQPGGSEAAAKVMLDDLAWWANALRQAKSNDLDLTSAIP